MKDIPEYIEVYLSSQTLLYFGKLFLWNMPKQRENGPEGHPEVGITTRRTFLEHGVRAALAALVFTTGCGGFPIVIPPVAAIRQRWRNNKNEAIKPPTPEERKQMEEEQRKTEQARFENYRKDIESRGSFLLMPGQMLRVRPGQAVETSVMASQGWRLLIVCERNTGEVCLVLYNDKTSLSPLAFKPCEDLALTLIGYDPEFGKTLRQLGVQENLVRKISGGSETHDQGIKIAIEPCTFTKTEVNEEQGWMNRFTAEGYETRVIKTDDFYAFPG